MIEVKNLTKKYGSQICLDDVCLSLEEGRLYGMVGENGAGKSTLFRCLNNLEDCGVRVEAGVPKDDLCFSVAHSD